jgi:hypothetical protein
MHLAKTLSSHLGSKQIAEIIAEMGLMSKKDAYQLALEIKKPAN